MDDNSQNNSGNSTQYDTPISKLDLSVRAYNCLKRSGVNTVGDIIEMTTSDIDDVKNMNLKTWEEVVDKLQKANFRVSIALRSYLSTVNKDATGFDKNTSDYSSPLFSDEASASEYMDTAQKQLSIFEITSKTKQLQEALSDVLFGQDNAIDMVTEGYFKALLSRKTNNNRNKPLATFLFAGSPGVGKTFMAETFAQKLGLPYMRFDMSEYADKEATFEFIGTDKAYRNSKCGNVTGFVHNNPKCVLLFDEIEKAHINVIHLFLQMLDRGYLRDSYTDIEVPFADAIIIFTTNAGKQLYEDNYSDLSTVSRNVIIDALSKDINPLTKVPFFPAAICSRFASGNVVLFNHITAADLYQIAKKEISRNVENIEKSVGIHIDIEESVYSSLLFSQGARLDARTVKNRAESFVISELYKLLRLISENSAQDLGGSLKSISIKSALPTGISDIDSLFFSSSITNILFFGKEQMAAFCENTLNFCNIITTNSIDEAKDILNRKEISVILVEPSFDKSEAFAYLDKEDLESASRSFRKYLQANQIEQPVYLVYESDFKINGEEKRSFMHSGIKDFLCVNPNRTKDFARSIQAKCHEAYIQKNIKQLIKSNKCLNFEVRQTYENGVAQIVLYDFKLVTSINAEDRDSIVGDLSRPNVSFDDVIGANAAKEELKYFVNYLKNPQKYVSSGVKAPRGILLYGPPGTGKTMLAKAMAGESGVTFMATEGNKFVRQYEGAGKDAVHKLFATAKKYSPTIIFIDEIDVIAKERTGLSANSEATLTAFFTEMDGFTSDPKNPVFVLAATNYGVAPGTYKSLDSAFVRRFDRSIFVDLPGKNDRIVYIKRKASTNTLFEISDEMIESIAVRSTGMSIASLESVFEMALRDALRNGQEKVSDEVLEDAFETMRFGEEKSWDKEQILRIARHECGHALLSRLSGNKPTYITIVARGNHGGYLQHAEDETKAIYTKEELLNHIRVSLAGRAAEMVYYGGENGISTSALDDLKNAVGIARSMVCDYGMDSSIGLAGADNVNSEKVNDVVNVILQQEMKNAMEAIAGNMETVDKLVYELVKKDHLSESEINDILG